MSTLIFIPCTERKRISPPEALRARSLGDGSVDEIAQEWDKRLKASQTKIKPYELYCGRSYKDAREAATLLGAELVVISAGLGLVQQDDEIPAYGLTVTGDKPDSIMNNTYSDKWALEEWWQALGQQTSASISFDKLISDKNPSLILASLSESYAQLVFRELETLSANQRKRFRIFGAGISNHVPDELADAVMPYDTRLNGKNSPLPGTMSDFASRAIHHYAQCLRSGLIDGRSAESDRVRLSEMMRGWLYPTLPQRERLSDVDVVRLILANWERTQGRSGESLRLLRDSGYACEQGRFKSLFHRARTTRQVSDGKIA